MQDGKKAFLKSIKEKIALFCSVEARSVITAMDVSSIYEVPLSLEKEGLCEIVLEKMGMKPKKLDLERWQSINQILSKPEI